MYCPAGAPERKPWRRVYKKTQPTHGATDGCCT